MLLGMISSQGENIFQIFWIWNPKDVLRKFFRFWRIYSNFENISDFLVLQGILLIRKDYLAMQLICFELIGFEGGYFKCWFGSFEIPPYCRLFLILILKFHLRWWHRQKFLFLENIWNIVYIFSFFFLFLFFSFLFFDIVFFLDFFDSGMD